MLITRLICNTRPVSLTIEVSLKFCSKRFSFFRPPKCSLVPKYSTLSSDRIRGPTRSGKARHLLNMPYWSRRDIYSHFPRSPLGTLRTVFSFWRAHTKTTPPPPPKKKCLHFQSLTSKASGNKKLQSALRIVIY